MDFLVGNKNSVTATIIIENTSKWNLEFGRSYASTGWIKKGASWINSGETEVWETRRDSHSRKGSSGVIVYSVEGLNTSIAIAWSAPSNVLAYTVIEEKEIDFQLEELYKNIIESGNKENRCIRDFTESSSHSCNPSMFVVISGTIGGDSYHPHIKITVSPRDTLNKFIPKLMSPRPAYTIQDAIDASNSLSKCSLKIRLSSGASL